MRTWMKWMAPVMGMALAMGLSASVSRADDAPAAATAKVVVTVVDGNGKAVANADVRLVTPRGKGQKAPADTGNTGDNKPKLTPVAQGTTAADGTVSFPNIAEGHYGVLARAKGVGRGMARVSVSGSADVTVTVTLEPKGSSPKGPNAPATPTPPAPPDDSK